MKDWEKIWIIEDGLHYPGLIRSTEGEIIHVYKYALALWKPISVSLTNIKPRAETISYDIFTKRKELYDHNKSTRCG